MTIYRALPRLAGILALLASGCARRPEGNGFRVPDGFVVEETAAIQDGRRAAGFTFDSQGRPVVLFADGRAAGPAAEGLRDVRAMWFDGPVLLAIGRGASGDDGGLYRCSAGCELLQNIALGSGAYAIRRGADGEPVVLLGRSEGRPGELARFDRRTRQFERLVHGLGEAGDFAVTAQGELLAFDGDGEKEQDLPWYRGTRSLHLVRGGDYGWRDGPDRLAAYMLDGLPGIGHRIPGVPGGVEVYASDTYPPRYRGAYFEAARTQRRVFVSWPVRCGGTLCLDGAREEFLRGVTGDIVDIEVGPDGNLWFATEAGLYRIAYRPGLMQTAYSAVPPAGDDEALVRQAQPLSSWGYEALRRRKAALGDEVWDARLQRLARNRAVAPQDRIAAVFLLQRHGPRPAPELLETMSRDGNGEVRSAAVLAASYHDTPRAKSIVTGALNDEDAFVRRLAMEGMVRMGLSEKSYSTFAPVNIVYSGLSDRDRYVRYSARTALERYPRATWERMAVREAHPLAAPEAIHALARTAKGRVEAESVVQLALEKMQGATADVRALRALQIAAERVPNGLSDELRKSMFALVAPLFPAADDAVNHELARAIAFTRQPASVQKILRSMPAGDEKQPLQMHYAYCLHQMRDAWTSEELRAMEAWRWKAQRWRGGPRFLGYLMK